MRYDSRGAPGASQYRFERRRVPLASGLSRKEISAPQRHAPRGPSGSRSEGAFALITASLAVLLAGSPSSSSAISSSPWSACWRFVVCAISAAAALGAREVLSWAHTGGPFSAAALREEYQGNGSRARHATSKAASTTLIANPSTFPSWSCGRVIDLQEQSRDDADSNSALVLV